MHRHTPSGHTLVHFRNQSSKVEYYGLACTEQVIRVAGSVFHEWVDTGDALDWSHIETLPFCYPENIYFLDATGRVAYHKSSAQLDLNGGARHGQWLLHAALILGNRCGQGSNPLLKPLGYTWLLDITGPDGPDYRTRTCHLSSLLHCGEQSQLTLFDCSGSHCVTYPTVDLLQLTQGLLKEYTFFAGDIVALPLLPLADQSACVHLAGFREMVNSGEVVPWSSRSQSEKPIG